MKDSLLSQAKAGYDAAKAGATVDLCPYLKSSSSWAAWMYGYGLELNHAPIWQLREVTQSRGYTLRVLMHTGVLSYVPFPK